MEGSKRGEDRCGRQTVETESRRKKDRERERV
jgi:hypothetical protein